ncbi:MAG: substrate-binding domain-containing protein [Pirellulales bacterium]
MIDRRTFHRRIAQAGLASATAGLWTGCTSREELPADGPAGASRTMTIGMIAKSQSNPVFLAARRGAEHQARQRSESGDVEVKLDWRTPNDEDAQKQAEFIEQLVAAGADAITIACSDASKVTRTIDDAIAKGAVVMCFDSDAPESKRLCYVGTDDVDAGRQVMRGVANLLEGQPGVIAILAGNQTATNLQKRVRGAEEELQQHENLQLKDVYYHKETPQDAYAMVESVQKANPEINGWAMIGGWPLMTDRALPWQPGAVKCVSMDTLPQQLEHLRMGDVQLLLGQRYFEFGQQCVDILVDKVLNGKDTAKTVDFRPLDPVTGENVNEYAKNWDVWS